MSVRRCDLSPDASELLDALREGLDWAYVAHMPPEARPAVAELVRAELVVIHRRGGGIVVTLTAAGKAAGT